MLSIIIPCFNKERNIRYTLDSIVNQIGFNEMRIICVDDKSSDQTLSILLEYENMHDNIQVIALNENSSGYEARRVGLINTETEYVGFMDPDDSATSGYYDEMLGIIEANQCDIICNSNIEKMMDNHTTLTRVGNVIDEGMYDNRDHEALFEKLLFDSGMFVLWNKIYRTSIFKDYVNSGRFHINIGNDHYPGIIAIANCTSFIQINDSDQYYIYNLKTDTQHTSKYSDDKHVKEQKINDYKKLSIILASLYLHEHYPELIDVYKKDRERHVKDTVFENEARTLFLI